VGSSFDFDVSPGVIERYCEIGVFSPGQRGFGSYRDAALGICSGDSGDNSFVVEVRSIFQTGDIDAALHSCNPRFRSFSSHLRLLNFPMPTLEREVMVFK